MSLIGPVSAIIMKLLVMATHVKPQHSYQMVKKFENVFTLFDAIHKRDRQTDSKTSHDSISRACSRAAKCRDVPWSVHHGKTAEISASESHEDGSSTVYVVTEQDGQRACRRMDVTQHEERYEESAQQHWDPDPPRTWLHTSNHSRVDTHTFINSLESKGNYSAASNNMKLVH